MARPATLADARKLNLWIDGDSIEQLDAMRRAHGGIPSRAEMIRRLIQREWQRLAPSEPKPKKAAAPSVCTFLRRHGGIRDEHGELAAMQLHRERPGLLSRRGLSLDHARELLVEAGYLHESGPDRPAITTVNDVVELIRDELQGITHQPNDIPF